MKVLCSKLRLEGNFDFTSLAKVTPGYVGADLAALTGAAGVIAVKRIFKQLSDGSIVLPELEQADETMAIDSSEVQTSEAAPTLPTTTPQPTIFANLPQSLKANSIVHFLIAHPNPLTEAQLAPLFISSADFF